jgi:hypothetical protein
MEVDRFHGLNAFIAVVEAGGFVAAAHRTGDSQSAISKATLQLKVSYRIVTARQKLLLSIWLDTR